MQSDGDETQLPRVQLPKSLSQKQVNATMEFSEMSFLDSKTKLGKGDGQKNKRNRNEI